LNKLDSGEFDAIVLAQAGLSRLGIQRSDASLIEIDQSLPAPGQGALGIEVLADSPVVELLEQLLQPAVARCVRAERGISAGLGADCALPVAAHAVLDEQGSLFLRALVAAPDGSQILRAESRGMDPENLAVEVVEKLRNLGAQSILDSAKAS